MINISGFNDSSIVDGEGLRYVIYTQGCKHHCLGCHNSSTWSTDTNQLYSVEDIVNKVNDESLSKNVTISGGDPLLQVDEIYELCKKFKEENYNIWLYTGYTLEIIKNNKKLNKILNVIDVLVDGKFEIENKDFTLNYKGSTNQRIIKAPF